MKIKVEEEKKMIDVILDTLIDGIKLVPFLFIAFLIMEYLEHKTSSKTEKIIKKSGSWGPLMGGLLGIFPQCGFSTLAANLYSARIITMGTLIAVFLSTSDEMLPILISEAAPISVILQILSIKLVISIIAGFIVDSVMRNIKSKKDQNVAETVSHICEHEHCDCEHGIVKSSIKHTINIFAFILLITFVINTLIYVIGEENISNFISNYPTLGIMLCGIVGFIPNCASSVVITELYLNNLISMGAMIAGLLVGSGGGILVLFKTNKHVKENIGIMGILYLIGVISGILIDLL